MYPRHLLWAELKKLNPNSTQEWPHVSIKSLKKEINFINLPIIPKIKKAVIYNELISRYPETNIDYKKSTSKSIKTKINNLFKNEIQEKIKSISRNAIISDFLKNPSHHRSLKINASELKDNLKKINLHQDHIIEMSYLVNNVETHKIITNFEHVNNLLNIIKNGFVETITDTYGSDVEAIHDIILYGGDIELKWYDKTNYHTTNNGAYFKYFHNLEDIDLSRYQVYNKTQEINYEPCLYYAFEQAGVKKDVLDQLKFLIVEKDILLRELSKIAEVIEYKIEVAYSNSEDLQRTRIYGKQFNNTIRLALIDEHYFINEQTVYTSQILTGNRDSRNRKISSYTLIRGLLKHKDRLLAPITIENINNFEHSISFEKDYILRDLKRSEFKDYTSLTSKVFQGKWKEDDPKDPNKNYKICFVDLETYYDNYHKAYCLGYSYENEQEIKHFYGLDCVEQFLKSINTNTVIITHNLAFDFRGFIDHLTKFSDPIETGTKLKHIQCKFNNYHLLFKDNCAFLPFKLSALPEMFNLPSGDKGVYPYTLITKDNINDHIDLKDVLLHIKANDHLDFISNCNKIDCINNDLIDIKKYTIHYCNQDINILKQAYLLFREQIRQITKLDILTLISLPQLADKYFISQGVYKGCVKISGVAQDFIRRAAHGGRVMTNNNEKFHIKDKKLSDFDAVSLYPSAMHRLPGYLQGIPKLITDSYLDKDYYFIEIEITNIKIKRDFPIASIKSKSGIKDYTNDIIGEKLVVDKITLEDLIEFHGIEYKFIRGYYFNYGFNTTIKKVIEFMFHERIKLKKQGNPLQNAYKLILNASYGKLIQKPIKKTKKFYNGNYRNYVIRNAKNIIDYQRINENLICINQRKSIIDHFTGCHMACQVLSMSKRIMNEVMCLAEDNEMKIYYQDTDSMHIEQKHINNLSVLYNQKYNKKLIGSGLGQFHSDFSIDGADKDYEITAVESIFLGKKAYIDKLEFKINNNIHYDYHIRMKGMPAQIIKNYNKDVMSTYQKLFNGEVIELDMVECCPLEMTKNYRVINRIDFKRKLKFFN